MDTQQSPVLLTDIIQPQKAAAEKGQKSNFRHQIDDLLFGSVMLFHVLCASSRY